MRRERKSTCISKETALLVHVIIAAGIEQHDLFFRYHGGQRDAITAGEADRPDAGLLAAGMVVVKAKLKSIFFQIEKDAGNILRSSRWRLANFLALRAKWAVRF